MMNKQYFNVKAAGGGSTSITSAWVKPVDWIDISAVNNNEINILVTSGTGIAFAVTTTSGTYSIDWGDGIIETGRVSGTIYQHQHTTGGTPCSFGYNTWKIQIFGASTAVKTWKVARHNYTNRTQYSPILWAVFGTINITSYSNAFCTSAGDVQCKLLQACSMPSFVSCLSVTQMFCNCTCLSSVTLPTSWGSVTGAGGFFSYCYSLSSVTLPTSWGSITDAGSFFSCCYALSSVTLPSSWGNIISVNGFFYNCYSLSSVTLPTSWGSITNTNQFFYFCYSLSFVTLPTSWGSVTGVNGFFYNCYALSSVILPTSWGSITSMSSFFCYCYSLKTLSNTEYSGSLTLQCDFTSFIQDCEFLQSNIVLNSLIKAVGIYGASGYLLKLTSIRLPNAGSLFAGSSPQINISYTSLDAIALDALFGDLPTLTGKTINITGCPGAATCTRSIATAKGWTVTG